MLHFNQAINHKFHCIVCSIMLYTDYPIILYSYVYQNAVCLCVSVWMLTSKAQIITAVCRAVAEPGMG